MQFAIIVSILFIMLHISVLIRLYESINIRENILSNPNLYQRLYQFIRTHINRVITILLCLALMSSVTVEWITQKIKTLPSIVQILYLTSIALIFITALFVLIRGTRIGNLYQRIVMVFLCLCNLSMICLSFVMESLKAASKGTLSFALIIVAIAMFTIPLIVLMKTTIEQFQSRIFIVSMSIFTFVVIEIFILFHFGLYNLSSLDKIDPEADSIKNFFVLIFSASGRYLSQVPTETTKGFVPLAEYMINLIYNTLILGFFASYFSSILFRRNERNFE